VIKHIKWETFVPMYPQYYYTKDNTLLRSKSIGMWYAYLQWQVSNGLLIYAKYVFPDKRFVFNYGKNQYQFIPDFEVKYINTAFPEYQTFDSMEGGRPVMIRRLCHYHPTLRIRVIEPVEYKAIFNYFKDANKDLGDELVEETEWIKRREN